jgi:voltage-gated potassium channel
MTKKVFLFGYGRHARSIAHNLREDGFRLTIVDSNAAYIAKAREDDFGDVIHFDVTMDENLETLRVEPMDRIICLMDDEHLNVFLTLSLRPLFPECQILAISGSIYASQKLLMAGADKVIDLYEVSANRIHNLLNRPVSTRFLDRIFSDRNGLNFREIVIPQNSFLDGMEVEDVNFHACGVILVGIIEKEHGTHFLFITSDEEHKLASGDQIVCLGMDEDLSHFEALIKNKKESACVWPS